MTEKIEYEVVGRLGSIELRRYPRTTLAVVEGTSDDEAFGILFDFITGGNVPSRRIAMTAPVISTDDSFSFVMPSNEGIDSLPKPTNERVKVLEVPERIVAAIRFRGRTSRERVAAMEAELLGTLESDRLSTAGKAFLMRYNPPFIPGFLRRNEVGIQVSSDGRAGGT
jgi:hypothetical protein